MMGEDVCCSTESTVFSPKVFVFFNIVFSVVEEIYEGMLKSYVGRPMQSGKIELRRGDVVRQIEQIRAMMYGQNPTR